MNELLHLSTRAFAGFLANVLPQLGDDWWKKRVVSSLSFQQQRLVEEKKIGDLRGFDFAALVRLIDQNWYELYNKLQLPREGRGWIKELQSIRNRWAHLSVQAVSANDRFRDADTLDRVLQMLGADSILRTKVQQYKDDAVSEIVSLQAKSNLQPRAEDENEVASSSPAIASETELPSQSRSLFQLGDIVRLRSSTAVSVPIIAMDAGGSETRYSVFHEGKAVHYYESQLQADEQKNDATAPATIENLHAFLTSLILLSPASAKWKRPNRL